MVQMVRKQIYIQRQQEVILKRFANLRGQSEAEVIQRVPDTPDYERCEPIYETWAGWQTSTRDARSWRDLPWQAQAYLRRIEALAGVPIRYISVGPERDQLVVI